ncbi:hypothetical protein EI42_00333 [Thermosporothrix hazakensis]|uniref:Uncharacterized protein n=1 Tax=Thermosporothrix hazakensis TaxID=644383 RepID=A0A326UU73_THEHA|nr:hypothetical protein EI42_00333 [Thermosporothrix hazakensis]
MTSSRYAASHCIKRSIRQDQTTGRVPIYNRTIPCSLYLGSPDTLEVTIADPFALFNNGHEVHRTILPPMKSATSAQSKR